MQQLIFKNVFFNNAQTMRANKVNLYTACLFGLVNNLFNFNQQFFKTLTDRLNKIHQLILFFK